MGVASDIVVKHVSPLVRFHEAIHSSSRKCTTGLLPKYEVSNVGLEIYHIAGGTTSTITGSLEIPIPTYQGETCCVACQKHE